VEGVEGLAVVVVVFPLVVVAVDDPEPVVVVVVDPPVAVVVVVVDAAVFSVVVGFVDWFVWVPAVFFEAEGVDEPQAAATSPPATMMAAILMVARTRRRSQPSIDGLVSLVLCTVVLPHSSWS